MKRSGIGQATWPSTSAGCDRSAPAWKTRRELYTKEPPGPCLSPLSPFPPSPCPSDSSPAEKAAPAGGRPRDEVSPCFLLREDEGLLVSTPDPGSPSRANLLRPPTPAGPRWLSWLLDYRARPPAPLLPSPAGAGPQHCHAKPHEPSSAGHKRDALLSGCSCFTSLGDELLLAAGSSLRCLPLLLDSPLLAPWR